MSACEGDVCTPAQKPKLDAKSDAAATTNKEENKGKVVKIDIISDNICPWCYVGKKRLEKALKQVDPNKAKIEINWRPFFLDPTLPKPGVDKMAHYAKKFGKQRAAQMLPHMKEVGKADGINFSYGGKIGNTMNSHRLVEFAKQKGKQNEMIDTLFAYYFEQERDIADDAVLVEAATKAGLDKAEVTKFLAGDEFRHHVEEDVQKAHSDNDVSGVPYFVIDGKYEFSGAQEPEVFTSIFKKIGAL